ncbi:MAG: hypothetical protein ACI8PD_002145, partial [Nitrospinales bacterium]
SGSAVMKTGQAGDMAYVFDSKVHGDPFTEIFRSYEGDEVRVKLVQGAQEVQHGFSIQGMRWKRSAWNPDSPYVNMQEVGISEHFEIHLPRIPARLVKGKDESARKMDFLYHFGSTDDMWNGDWGLMRYADPVEEASKVTSDLTKLAMLNTNPMFTDGGKLIKVKGKTVCPKDPKGKATKDYYVQAWAAGDLTPGGITYNSREGINDPSGLRYIEVSSHDLTREQVIAEFANKPVEPMVLRANAGSCLKVHLKNMLPVNVPDQLGDAGLPTITPLKVDDFRPSNRVSLMPQLVTLDSELQNGANVGINATEQTVGPGETIDYDWYAGRLDYQPHPTKPDEIAVTHVPVEFGSINLNSYGDIIKQGAQGLIGVLVVEPEKATVTVDPSSDLVAEVCHPLEVGVKGSPKVCFQEFVVVYQDGLNLNHNNTNIPNCFVCDDTYDLGEKAMNYRAEPFWARLGLSPNNDDTNSSRYPENFFLESFKSIETGVFEVSSSDKVRFRVMQPHGRARQRTFLVYGHQYNDYGIENFGTPNASLISVGKGITAELESVNPGTWLFRDGPNFMFSAGVWGQFVVDPPTAP